MSDFLLHRQFRGDEVMPFIHFRWARTYIEKLSNHQPSESDPERKYQIRSLDGIIKDQFENKKGMEPVTKVLILIEL